MPLPMNSLHQQVTESSTFFLIHLSFCPTLSPTVLYRDSFIHSLYPPERLFFSFPPSSSLNADSSQAALQLLYAVIKLDCTSLSLSQERESGLAGFMEMLMCLKGNISLPDQRRLEKSALWNICLFHLAEATLSLHMMAICSGAAFRAVFMPMQPLLLGSGALEPTAPSIILGALKGKECEWGTETLVAGCVFGHDGTRDVVADS